MDKRSQSYLPPISTMSILTKPTGCAFRPSNRSLGLPGSDHQALLLGRHVPSHHWTSFPSLR